MPSYYFAIVGILLIASMLLYFKLATKFLIVDKPNERSSHTKITIRGAGILYIISFIFYFLFSGFEYTYIFSGALVLSTLSFIDDIKDLSAKLRLVIHFAMISLFLWSQGIWSEAWWIIGIYYFFFIGMMNAYNFMDGLNGISFLTASSVLISLWYVDVYLVDFMDANLLIFLMLANIVFGYYNFRKKAKCFLGDIGSITLGFIFIALAVILYLKLDNFGPLMLFMVYGIDAGWTIFQRLLQKENIFKPHRKHLYHIMANEMRVPHLLVSTIYFVFQMLVNLYWLMNFEDKDLNYIVLYTFISTSILYWIAKGLIMYRIKKA